ncbi:MAG: PHP domain-containing protein [Victivallaceae bacterium]|nr:PHP domain-containing protein [Victivallaceae bacterium]
MNRLVNLHTHTPMCHHATGDPRAMCRLALQEGYSVFGFSDHAPFPDRHVQFDRMGYDDIGAYECLMKQLAAEFPGLRIPVGLELDYVPGEMDIYRREYHECRRFDYLIGSVHQMFLGEKFIMFIQRELYGEEAMLAFVEGSIDMARHCRDFITFLAHPDVAAFHYVGGMTAKLEKAFRELGKISREENIPLEVNANGMRRKVEVTSTRRGYPWREAWEILASEGAPAIIGLDAHHLPNLSDGSFRKAADFARQLGLRIVNDELAEKILSGR